MDIKKIQDKANEIEENEMFAGERASQKFANEKAQKKWDKAAEAVENEVIVQWDQKEFAKPDGTWTKIRLTQKEVWIEIGTVMIHVSNKSERIEVKVWEHNRLVAGQILNKNI